LFISYKPHFTSAMEKKKVVDITASIGGTLSARMRHFQHKKVGKLQSNAGI